MKKPAHETIHERCRAGRLVRSLPLPGVGLAACLLVSWPVHAQAPAEDTEEAMPRPVPESSGLGHAGRNVQRALGESRTGQGRVVKAECGPLPNYEQLSQVLREVVTPGDTETNGGLGNHMWATVVDRSGAICVVTRSGESFGEQWPGSRGISAEKAFTANAYSLPGFALSTANLYWPSKPGNSLYGLELGNPVDEEALYQGPASAWGQPKDPLVGRRIGGTIVFAGGLPLYNPEGEIVGALGLSGDKSCTDHVIAWKVRHHLNLDNVPAGVTEAGNDNIIFDVTVDPASGMEQSASGYGHPSCGPTAKRIAEDFSEQFPTGPEE